MATWTRVLKDATFQPRTRHSIEVEYETPHNAEVHDRALAEDYYGLPVVRVWPWSVIGGRKFELSDGRIGYVAHSSAI